MSMQEQTVEQPKKRPGDSWRPVDLSSIIAGDFVTPTPTVGLVDGVEHGLFYEGRINSIFGDSGGGKTLFLLHLMKEVIIKGHDCVLIDYEDSAAATCARLKDLGVPPAMILKHFLYFQPEEKWSPPAKKAVQESLSGRDVMFAIIDSTGEGMAIDGVNPNSDDDVARWFRGTARCLAKTGAAVVLVDHVPKKQQNGRNTDFATGSHRKRAAINGAAYLLEVVSAPSRTTVGRLKLKTQKCRYGHRKHGTLACEIVIQNPDPERNEIEVKVSSPMAASGDGSEPTAFRPTWYMQRISEYLSNQSVSVSKRSLRNVDGLGKKGGKAGSNYVEMAVTALVAEGYVEELADGKIKHVSLYTEASDSKTGPF
jgi:hypothetical protein